jgi:hypothetical protein
MRSMDRSDFHRQLVDGALVSLAGWGSSDNHWSFDVMWTLVRDAPEIAWPILLEIADTADDAQLGLFGAGILEDFIAEHGRQFIDRIEERAASDPRFRLALQNVWRQGGPRDVWDRVVPLLDGRPDRVEGLTSDQSTWLRLSIAGLPPGSPGSAFDEVARRRRLLETVREEDHRPVRDPFDGPVVIEVHLKPGPESLTIFDSARVLAMTIETLSADRTFDKDLADLGDIALIASAGLVWDATFRRVRRRVEAYLLEVRAMVEGQVAAYDDPTSG